MRTLHELPRFRDRWSYIYLEKGRMEVSGSGLRFYQKGQDGVVPIPIDQLAVVMLGPGTTITHAAVKALAQNNSLLAWTGEQGVRLYAANTGGTFSARRLIRQAALVSNERTRLEVARRMYQFRFRERLPDDASIEAIRGMEGIRVRRAYAEAALEYGVEWKGRNYDQNDWFQADPINRALSTATACLYGVCHAGILSAGYSPALGFIHTGKMLSFVYDIADLYKTKIVVPLAFRIVSEGAGNLERTVRLACRDAFAASRIMNRILPDIAEVLDARDDSRESADEFEERAVTLAH